jgi:hypothetical protein
MRPVLLDTTTAEFCRARKGASDILPRFPQIISHQDTARSKVEATMRKRVITPVSQNASVPSQAWLDVESAAVVEVTSEDTAYPIESAVLLGQKQGWRAAKPGTQTIRLIFDEPHNLRRIRLVFDETETRRTQEFLLRWSADTGHSFREIVRQQWNFSPPETVREVEDYAVELSEVRILELIIVPDKSGGEAHASLESLRLA